MTMPNIPNITPLIKIDREKAINMLIASIAMEEMGLAHIINAESEKIKYVLDKNKCRNISPKDIKEINQGVRYMIKDIMKLEMFLQEKLETIIRIIPKQKKELSNSKNNSCRKKSNYNWIGFGKVCGKIVNLNDLFHCGNFNLEVNINNSSTILNQFIKYTIRKTEKNTSLYANLFVFPNNVSFKNIKNSNYKMNVNHSNITIVKGKGLLSFICKNNSLKQFIAEFSLVIWNYNENEYQKIKMVIRGCDNKFIHDSGIISLKHNKLVIDTNGNI